MQGHLYGVKVMAHLALEWAHQPGRGKGDRQVEDPRNLYLENLSPKSLFSWEMMPR